MKLITRLLIILFFIGISFLLIRCNKNDSEPKTTVQRITDPSMLEKIKANEIAQIKTGIKILDAPMTQSISANRVQSNCITSGFVRGNTTVIYQNGNCLSLGTYTAVGMQFSLGVGKPSTLLDSASLPAIITFKYSNGTQSTITPTLTYVGKLPSGLYSYTISNFTIPNYCSVDSIDLTVSPNVICSDGNTYTGNMDLILDITAQKADMCATIAPLFVTNGGMSGQLSVSGFITPCPNPTYTPCMTMPDGFVFYYRVAGTTTWSSVTYPIYGAGYIIYLASGSYEYYWVGTKLTSPTCYSFASPIYPVTVL